MNGFRTIRRENFDDFKVEAVLMAHERTGARLIALLNEDENRTFSISFRTPPADSKGEPHILEHSVLCGSRSYPLRDPFAVLLKSSLNTFLNAFTASLYTSYPVASQNEEDFRNLVTVYLDAVLHPLLSKETFLRQAWHNELEADGIALTRKGVVLNEMRGRYGESDSILYRALLQNLLADTPHRFDSGGNPEVIPDLSYEELKDFYSRYYHPSNSFMYLYGKVDLEWHLSHLDSLFAEYGMRACVLPNVIQSRSIESEVVLPFTPAGESAEDSGDIIVLAWYIPYKEDLERELGLALLSRLLFGSQAARLTRALVESGLGKKPAGFGLFDVEGGGIFSAGLRGVRKENLSGVEEVIEKTLREITENSFPADEIEAAVNSFEFGLREQIANSPSRGISMMSHIMGPWLYRDQPFHELGIFQALEKVRKRLEQGERFFEGLTSECLVSNRHRLKLLLEASDTYAMEKAHEEEKRCVEVLQKLSAEEKSEILKAQKDLEENAAKEEPEELVSRIPVLKVSSIDPAEKETPSEREETGGCSCFFQPLSTADIIYMQAGFDLRVLPRELLPYVPLFMRALTGTGAGDKDYIKLTYFTLAKTGGVGTSRVCGSVRDTGELALWFILESSALLRESEALFTLLGDITHRAWLDNKDRCLQLARIMKASFEESLVSRPVGLAIKRANASLAESSMLEEKMSGISQLLFLRTLVPEIEQDWPSVQEKLEQIRNLLFTRGRTILNATIDADRRAIVQPRIDEYASSIADKKLPVAHGDFMKACITESVTVPVQVSYVAVSVDLGAIGYKNHGSLSVVMNYLRDTWLWEQIRVQGGAYGGGCAYDETTNVLGFFSWDDPNPLNTIDVIRRTADHLNNLSLPESEISRNIIGTIGNLDRPLSPYSKGVQSRNRYLLGITHEQRQRERHEVLGAGPADFRRVGEVLAAAWDHRSISVMSPKPLGEGYREIRL